jgi:hypothetical protein
VVNLWINVRILCVLALTAMATACGPGGRDVFDTYNSRDTGPWLSLGRTQGSDGSLVVHVAASHPEHAEAIARHIVRQNYATSATAIRVIVDPASGEGDRHVYRWDGRALTADTDASGLPPRGSAASSQRH